MRHNSAKYALFLVIACCGLLSGCATVQPLYFWGSYEPLTYGSYTNPGKLPPQAQIDRLEADKQRAASRNAALPPGFHAYLGYLYYEVGNGAKAAEEFAAEKALFPESAAFIDQLTKAPAQPATSG
jgi:hypothetical protein